MVAAEFDFMLAPGEEPVAAACLKLLRENGKVLIQLAKQTSQTEGKETFQKLIKALGNPHNHDRLGTTVWDVKYQPDYDTHELARSLTMSEFPMHTDGSFEDPAPDSIGLYIVREDRFGAGVTTLVDSRDFIKRLSTGALNCLTNTKFPMRVPAEFNKGTNQVSLSIVTGDSNFRFREELIIRELCTAAQIEAIDELNSYLQDESLLSSLFLPTNSIMLLDNGRYFHGRTQVKDPERHLLRVRFNVLDVPVCAA